MNDLWGESPSEMCSLMLKLGKHRAKRDKNKIAKIVDKITGKYKSLRNAWRYIPYSWTQFRRLVSVKISCHKKT